MKAYVVAAGAAVILFSVLALVLLVAIRSGTERPLHVEGTGAGAGGSPEAGPPQGRGAGDPTPTDPGPGPMDLDPDMAAEVEALLRGDDPGGDPQDDRPPSPLAAGDCELAISVSDPAGEPVPRIVATLLAGLSRGRAETDEGGICVFSEIAPGSYTLRLEGEHTPEMEAARAIVLEPGERRELRLTLGSFDLSIAGRVLNADGQPVPGTVVEARKYLVQPQETDLVLTRRMQHTVTTGESGGYEIRGLEAAEYLLSTRATETYRSVRQVVRAGNTSADLLLVATEKIEVAGRVLASDGTPLEGARVVSLRASGASVLTDQKGEYRLALDVSEGDDLCILKVSRQGFRDARVNVSLGEVDPLDPRVADIALEALGETGVVFGLVLDGAGKPVEGETIHMYSSELRARYQAVSDQDGAFRIDGVQLAEDYKVWLFPRASFKDFSLRPVAVGADGVELEVRLERVASGTVRGRMVDPLGRPVPDFVFWLRSTKAQGRSVSVTSDGEGRFEAMDVPAGSLIFETRSLPRFTVKGFVLEPESELDATLVLDWGDATLAGTVLSPEGDPLPGAKVNLLWTHNAESRQSVSFRHTVTDAAGRFSFADLSAGAHRIHVVAGEYRGVQISHNVGNDPTEPVIRMEPGGE